MKRTLAIILVFLLSLSLLTHRPLRAEEMSALLSESYRLLEKLP